MSFSGVTILLPGHGWDEIAAINQPGEASGLLCGITAAWHPAVVNAVAGIPKLQPIFDLDRDLTSQIIIVPPSAEDGCAAIQLDDSNQVLRPTGMDREAFCQALLQTLDLAPTEVGVIACDLVRDFWALGYTYLQIKLLTHRMHYSSGFDETALGELSRARSRSRSSKRL